jgi:Na+/melibiose symporter-like transporter
MQVSPPVTQNTVASVSDGKPYHCGTLSYTKAGLFVLFAWLLWGDFCFTMMEAVVPSIMPLKMKALGCPNWLMGAILTTAPGIISMTVGPYVSFKSDRYRSRWGRRIPFILFSMPFLCICLALLGFSDDICALLRRNSQFLEQYAPSTITIVMVAFFLIMFKFFDMFVNSVFWYLFNDVVPVQFLSRFMGAFKIVGTGASALYNCFIFRYAETHMREILVGAALLYFIGFGLACLMIKEGQYPPPSDKERDQSKGFRGLLTFFRESFSHKFYWFRFFSTAITAIAFAISPFNIFFNQEMGLSLAQIGYIAGLSSVIQMSAMYLMAIFVDRWHPIRICAYGAIFTAVGTAISMVWLFVTIPGVYFFWMNMGNAFIGAFLSALLGVAALPCEMRIFPKSRFGQFCSAQAMLRNSFTVLAGIMAGLFIDTIKVFCNGSDFAYRFKFVWLTIFIGLGAIFMTCAYREWYRLGGDKHFHPPAPWNPNGVEEMPVVPIICPQSKWLNVFFVLFDCIMGLSTFGTVLLMWWMFVDEKMLAFKWFGLIVLPLSVLGWLLWLVLRRSIRRDIDAAKNGLPLKNGIPHHGMLIIFASKFLIAIGLWVAQVIVCLVINLESGAIVFGLANAITNFILIGTVYLLCRIERGNSTVVDEKLEADPDLTPSPVAT